MACTPIATATLFETTTSESLSTSFSQSTSSLPDTTSTSSSESCVSTTTLADNSTACASTTTIVQVTTIPGGQTILKVPVVTEVPVTRSFPTETLFGTCPDTTTSPTTTTTSSTSTHSTPTTTSLTSQLTTGPPVVVTSHSSKTLDNGSVVLTTVIITSSVSPSYVYVSTAVPDQQVQGANNSSHSGSKLGPIIGGAVGGVVLLIGLAAIVWFFVRKRRIWDDIFDKDDGAIDFRPSRLVRDPSMRMSLDMGSVVEPKPYTYGLLGHTGSPSFGSPPSSPTGQSYPQYVVTDDGQAWGPDYNQHSGQSSGQTSWQNTMSDRGQALSPVFSQHSQQYGPDHIETQHNRRPSGTSLLYTPLVLSNTRISPEPSIAPSVYSQNSRPGYSTRDSSSSSGSAPLVGASRPSTGGSMSSHYHQNMPAQMQQAQQRGHGPRRMSRTDEYPVGVSSTEYNPRPPSISEQSYVGQRPPSQSSSLARPISPPRPLMMTNWNPSTDAISVNNGGPPRPPMMMDGSAQPRPGHTVNSSVSSSATIPANAAYAGFTSPTSPEQAGPSRLSQIVTHTDGGRIMEGEAPTGDVKAPPAHAPPAYEE